MAEFEKKLHAYFCCLNLGIVVLGVIVLLLSDTKATSESVRQIGGLLGASFLLFSAINAIAVKVSGLGKVTKQEMPS